MGDIISKEAQNKMAYVTAKLRDHLDEYDLTYLEADIILRELLEVLKEERNGKNKGGNGHIERRF